jgi:hypothetical protein
MAVKILWICGFFYCKGGFDYGEFDIEVHFGTWKPDIIGTCFHMEVLRMAKKKAKKASSKEVLVVASKMKAYIKSKGMMTSADAIGALNDEIYKVIDAGIVRTKANKRSTVKPQDL